MKKRIEYYSAEWCGPCKLYRPTIQELKDSGMNISMYDIEKDKEQATKKGVMSIPVTIIYKGKKEITRLMGVQSKENLEYWMS
tara:strand:- start:764 stop:1012 length:249 start_codon:yes stop_codon:yes gene_type:complete